MKPDKKILIVEDEWFIAQDTKDGVENLGYKVCGIVPGGEEAIEIVETALPDLILMDIMLKGSMDGIEAARQIVTTHAIPIVYVTAYASTELMQRIKMTGPYGYILKPFKEAELHTAIEIAFYKHEMEDRRLHAQKLESARILAGGIAHDFNNVLFPVMGYAEMLKDDLPGASPLQDYADKIIAGVRRASELVAQILMITHHTGKALIPLHVQPIIRDVVTLSASSLPASIEIRQEISQDCGMIMADPAQFHQVITNLVTNAVHAMGANGGILTIRLREVSITDGSPMDLQLPSGQYVCLTVSDTGIGMNRETRNKIFEPYFTTKDKTHRGTGLGLSLVHAIVRTCKGEIVCESEPGRGTTFTVYLPTNFSSHFSPKGAR